ncbi:hypothetical protein THOM_0862 [Trachipleistophora hominis]|uniref:Uncharacterized protein n=1 Tax=Trachipleistophora hominis TaxID=72359 RepID=L7JY02_TRAHO|nr:hypothetical protein THOM_0862 [Trachipleistophora hominis]
MTTKIRKRLNYSKNGSNIEQARFEGITSQWYTECAISSVYVVR